MAPKVFFDPKYLANPWEFCKKIFTTLYPSHSSTNFPYLRSQFYFRFEGRAPEKKFLDPQLYKIWSYDFAVFWHNDASWGPLENPHIWLKSDYRILRNWGKTDFSDFVFFGFPYAKPNLAPPAAHLLNYLDHFTQIIRTGYSEATVKILSPQPLPKWRGGTSNIASRDIFAVAGLGRFQPDFGLLTLALSPGSTP